MKKQRIFWASLVAGLIILIGLATYLAVPRSTVEAKGKDWVGSWDVTITVVNQNVTFPGLITFFRDGNVIADEVPSPLETSGHGNWVSTGRKEAAFAFEVLVGSPDGSLSLRYKVAGTAQYNAQTDTWSGPFTIDIFGADGNQVFADNGTMSGTRITVQP